MESGRTTIGRFSLAVVMVAAVVLAVGMPGQASALSCTAVGGVDVAGDCKISTPITAFCPFVLTVPAGDLLITSTGSINCNDAGVPQRRLAHHDQREWRHGDASGERDPGGAIPTVAAMAAPSRSRWAATSPCTAPMAAVPAP